MEDAVDDRVVVVGLEHRDRDRVLRDVHTEVGKAPMGQTGHGRLLPYVGSVRRMVDDPRRCGCGAGRSMLNLARRNTAALQGLIQEDTGARWSRPTRSGRDTDPLGSELEWNRPPGIAL